MSLEEKIQDVLDSECLDMSEVFGNEQMALIVRTIVRKIKRGIGVYDFFLYFEDGALFVTTIEPDSFDYSIRVSNTVRNSFISFSTCERTGVTSYGLAPYISRGSAIDYNCISDIVIDLNAAWYNAQ